MINVLDFIYYFLYNIIMSSSKKNTNKISSETHAEKIRIFTKNFIERYCPSLEALAKK